MCCCQTLCTNAFDDIFGVLGLKTFGQGDGGNLDGGETVGAVATNAGEMDVAGTMLGAVVKAETVLLRTCSVVDFVEQMSLGQGGEGAEQGAAVDRGQRSLEVGKRKSILKVTSDGFQNQDAHGCHADTSVLQQGFGRKEFSLHDGSSNGGVQSVFLDGSSKILLLRPFLPHGSNCISYCAGRRRH